MSSKTLEEAGRVMTICNACRYCEGFCAVFPAMELRRTFTDGDLKYLANLCHNCRDCYYACQYAPPHDFDLNFPKAMAELRTETYKEFAWPKSLARLFDRNGRTVLFTTLLSIFVVFLLTYIGKGGEAITGIHTGPNSFYQVIPYAAMLLPFSLLGLFVLVGFVKGIQNFWKETAEVVGKETVLDLKGNLQAIKDVLQLKYLEGGGHGCNYPDDEFSTIRRTMHHGVFYGFLLCLAATTIAAIYDHLFHLPAPYPFFSLPVLLGTVGGIMITAGCCGLLWLKDEMDKRPANPNQFGMDISFVILLMLTNVSGLFLLVLRDSALMGTFLILHLGLVLAFFLTMPYGKFVHGVYRYIALVRYAQEQSASRGEH